MSKIRNSYRRRDSKRSQKEAKNVFGNELDDPEVARMIKTFSQFLNETLILEMPHILINDKVYDLELEVHSKMSEKEFVDYIKDWIDGKPIKSKTPRIFDAS